jgi:hypothetical protein
MVSVTAFTVAVTAAVASLVEPVFTPGNPVCASDSKVEPVADGTYALGGITVTIDVTGTSFDFTSPNLITQVVVKGGPNANVYNYPAPGVSSDTGLHSPIHPGKGTPYGLSHLCFTGGGTPPPPPPPPPPPLPPPPPPPPPAP